MVDLRPSASSYPPPPYISGAAISNARGGGPDIVFPSDPLQGITLNVNPGSIYGSTGLSVPRAYQSHYFAGPPLKSSNSNAGVAPEEISPVNEHFASYRSSSSSAPSGVGRSRARDVDDAETSGNDAPRKKKARKNTAPVYAAAAEDVPAVTVSSGANTSTSKSGNAPQYVCVTCGRTDSPEWRKGPMGAKTLCNACGLRWAKRNQKKKAESAAAAAAEDDESASAPKETASKAQENDEPSTDKA